MGAVVQAVTKIKQRNMVKQAVIVRKMSILAESWHVALHGQQW